VKEAICEEIRAGQIWPAKPDMRIAARCSKAMDEMRRGRASEVESAIVNPRLRARYGTRDDSSQARLACRGIAARLRQSAGETAGA
jgi:hypothetical protein